MTLICSTCTKFKITCNRCTEYKNSYYKISKYLILLSTDMINKPEVFSKIKEIFIPEIESSLYKLKQSNDYFDIINKGIELYEKLLNITRIDL